MSVIKIEMGRKDDRRSSKATLNVPRLSQGNEGKNATMCVHELINVLYDWGRTLQCVSMNLSTYFMTGEERYNVCP